ncbi:MAG: hypothetical protein JWO08_1889, partial [Verrucomicrobiaceae bacterium]|nr:hypothetical protein [Verrucomicrobiaceae bacterium]
YERIDRTWMVDHIPLTDLGKVKLGELINLAVSGK